ncbi:hypothetical protein H6G89_28250 [Oscillatoria sp. FACHB-1407]|uniref:hypothetical protein n=1 Tax=Oscillatoria sp. FACHB-1407 TaxID=2692847 RepID=UPI00168289D4|nr:hypothetical protein [Oscillatoria sp. FACHB-1407]MBD2464900.1 hypothetical protein [Oscillatoria sp. FACHB-1407]
MRNGLINGGSRGEIASVLPVIFRSWGWRAIASWSGFWSGDYRSILCTTMGAIDLSTLATDLRKGLTSGRLQTEEYLRGGSLDNGLTKWVSSVVRFRDRIDIALRITRTTMFCYVAD